MVIAANAHMDYMEPLQCGILCTIDSLATVHALWDELQTGLRFNH